MYGGRVVTYVCPGYEVTPTYVWWPGGDLRVPGLMEVTPPYMRDGCVAGLVVADGAISILVWWL